MIKNNCTKASIHIIITSGSCGINNSTNNIQSAKIKVMLDTLVYD